MSREQARAVMKGMDHHRGVVGVRQSKVGDNIGAVWYTGHPDHPFEQILSPSFPPSHPALWWGIARWSRQSR